MISRSPPSEGINEWAERCLRTWPQLHAVWLDMRDTQKKAAAELLGFAKQLEIAHTVCGVWDGSEPEAHAECERLRALALRMKL